MHERCRATSTLGKLEENILQDCLKGLSGGADRVIYYPVFAPKSLGIDMTHRGIEILLITLSLAATAWVFGDEQQPAEQSNQRQPNIRIPADPLQMKPAEACSAVHCKSQSTTVKSNWTQAPDRSLMVTHGQRAL